MVKRSSARPDAIRAIRSAVAGATTIKSVRLAASTCATPPLESQRSEGAGFPDKASQVVLPTKFKLLGVGITVIECP